MILSFLFRAALETTSGHCFGWLFGALRALPGVCCIFCGEPTIQTCFSLAKNEKKPESEERAD